MKPRPLRPLGLIVFTFWLSACSMGQMVARTSVTIMDGSVDAMNRETDLQLAATAIPANLKLIEGLIAEDPANSTLAVYAAQGFYGYAFGFVELSDAARASALYRRGFDHARRALQRRGLTLDLLNAAPADIEQAVAKLGRGAVPALFWAASCWAKQIDLNRDDPERIAQLAGAERLMRRVYALQADYYYGGPHLFYAVYFGGRSPLFGGDFAKSEQNFERARAVTQGKLLIVDVLQAEYLERQRLDRQRFHALLDEVIHTPVGRFPPMALANQIARARARYLLGREDEWF